MRQNINIIVKLTLIILILFIPVAMLVLFLTFSNFINNLPAFLKYGGCFIYIAFTIWIFVRVANSNLLRDLLISASKKEAEIVEKHKNECVSLSIDRTKFKNTTKVFTQLNMFKGILFISVPIAIIVGVIISQSSVYIAAILYSFVAILIAHNYFGRIIKISPEGIKSFSLFKNQFINWKDVKRIGISVYGLGESNLDAFTWVYISSKPIKAKSPIIDKDGKGVITFKVRAKMIHHIMCLWDGEIVNIHNVRRWRKYLKKYGYIENQSDKTN